MKSYLYDILIRGWDTHNWIQYFNFEGKNICVNYLFEKYFCHNFHIILFFQIHEYSSVKTARCTLYTNIICCFSLTKGGHYSRVRIIHELILYFKNVVVLSLSFLNTLVLYNYRTKSSSNFLFIIANSG